jgi:hypothetical protein
LNKNYSTVIAGRERTKPTHCSRKVFANLMSAFHIDVRLVAADGNDRIHAIAVTRN